MKRLALLSALALGGCASPAPTVVTQTVVKAVPVSCVPASLPRAPNYVDSNKALKSAHDAAERFRLLAAGRIQRNNRLAVVEPVIEACKAN